MLLFRYFGSHALETLRDRHLKTATVSSLNDPFEMLYQLTGTMTASKAEIHLKRRIHSPDFLATAQYCNPQIKTKKDLKKFIAANKEKIKKNLVSVFSQSKAEDFIKNSSDRLLRLVCFSESKVEQLDEILIWSHYANKHTGARIGFEFPDGIINPFKIVPVQYQRQRVSVDMTQGTETELVKRALSESMRVKSLAWKYEREYRMLTEVHLCKNKPLEKGGNADFISFEKDWVKHVDFGVRATPNEIQAMKEFLQKEYPSVPLRKAVFHRSDYALEYQIM
jgi:hypothetical protein